MPTFPSPLLNYSRLTAMVCLVVMAAPVAMAAPVEDLALAYGSPFVFIAEVAIQPQVPQVTNAAPGMPTTFALTAGNLPDGLILSAITGTITGTPTVGGHWDATIRVTNGNRTATAQVSFTVTPAVD